MHRLKLLGCIVLLLAVLLIVYTSLIDVRRGSTERISTSSLQSHSRKGGAEKKTFVRQKEQDTNNLKKIAARPLRRGQLLHYHKGFSPRSVVVDIKENVDKTEMPKSRPTPPPIDPVALETARKYIARLQCSHQYKDYYRAFTDYTDITTLAVSPKRSNTASNRTGYILSLTFREQQTKASENLLSLQCWAKTLRVYVVEPFVQDSHLVAPMDNISNMLRFRDVFNIVRWQKATTAVGFPPLAGWDKFVQEAPRKLIVVYFKYPKYSYLRERKENGRKVTHLAISDNYTKGCIISNDLAEKINFLTTVHNFDVVRKVCINFEHGDELTLFQFNTHVYAHLNPKQHTVVMEQWRGANDISGGNRVAIYDACWTQYKIDPFLFAWPSHRVVCDADKYTSKYLKSDQYIALIVRTEKFKIPGVDRSEWRISDCLNQTLKVWRTLKQKTKLKLTYLSMDVGKYGSYTLTDKNFSQEYLPYEHLYDEFFKQIYGTHFTMRKWENEFETVATSLDSGYVGSLQKTIVAKAKCVVFSGGGSFQKHAKFMYEKLHKKTCIKVVQSCSRGMN